MSEPKKGVEGRQPSNLGNYLPVSLRSISGRDRAETRNLGLPAGAHHMQGIPFEIGWKVTLQEASAKISLKGVDIAEPTEVYLLLQGGWLLTSRRGKPIGKITLYFSKGNPLTVTLTAGDNIRDWSLDEPDAIRIKTADRLQEVWVGQTEAGNTRGRIDMLTITIPVHYHQATLTEIQVTNTFVAPWPMGSNRPCIHLLAITAKSDR
jgi:hypothetical protein